MPVTEKVSLTARFKVLARYKVPKVIGGVLRWKAPIDGQGINRLL
ncbi:MAG: hypothetical protein ABSF44_06965 [Candidatus Bathyarchaeia archaeon]|jgi:hypothetical protein